MSDWPKTIWIAGGEPTGWLAGKEQVEVGPFDLLVELYEVLKVYEENSTRDYGGGDTLARYEAEVG